MTRKRSDGARIATGVRNLDDLFMGGVPKGSLLVIGGPPGTGKTILTQQICFHNAAAKRRVLYFNTLSEPTAKTLRYLSQFSFFDAGKLENGIQFVDLGASLRSDGLQGASERILEHVRKIKPAIVVIDSFKVFDDLARSHEELRKFGYELAVNLMAWEATCFLLGEYGPSDVETNPLFSIIDGLLLVTQREKSGEQQRFLQLVKMRGTDHNRDLHPFVITSHGVEVFAPRVTILREDRGPGASRCKTGVSRLDDLLGEGIPRGSSLLIAGVAGTGKTILLLEFLYRGALAGEKGILFSFEETRERLLATARGLGWELDRELERGMVEIVFIPQPNIMVEGHLLMMRERIEKLGARRVAVDSLSVFLHKLEDPQTDREKVFQLASIVQNSQAVGFFATDIPYNSNQLSRFGVEETVVDGVILLTSTEEGLERHRYLEVYKLRTTAHLKGRHDMDIGPGGIAVYPRYHPFSRRLGATATLEASRRLRSGVSGLDELCGGGLIERSVTLVSGSAGIGKTTLAMQFIVEGALHGERGLLITLEEGSAQLSKTAASLGIPLKKALSTGRCSVVYLDRQHARAGQCLAMLDAELQAHKTKRLVIDSLGPLIREGTRSEDLRQWLSPLLEELKSRGVTSLLTLESDAASEADIAAGRGYSTFADNVLLLRYAHLPGLRQPSLSVIKTRGSAHDWGTYAFSIGRGGLVVGDRLSESVGADLAKPRSSERANRRAKARPR